MAAALFRDQVEQAQLPGEWRIESAGTWANQGEPVSEGARTVLAKRGLDIRQHRSRCVSGEILGSFDLILTMEQGHKEALIAEFPVITGRVFQLAEMAGFQNQNVADPYGRSLEEYEATAKEIDLWLARGFHQIVALAERYAKRRTQPR